MRKILFTLLLGIIGVTVILMNQPTKTMTIGEYKVMPHIDVTLDVLNIVIDNSPDDKIHVQIHGHKLNEHMLTITKENNRFFIKEQQRKKKWQENISFRSAPIIIVQLPKSQIKTLTLNSADGDFIMQNLALDTVQAEMSAGATTLKNISITNAKLHTRDGNVAVAKSTIENLLVTTGAGNVAIKESTGSTHTIQTVDGQIKMTEAIEQPNVHVKSVSGDIGIHYKKDPTSLQLRTVGGDVKITLPKYDRETHIIGDGTNMLLAETKNGVIVIK